MVSYRSPKLTPNGSRSPSADSHRRSSRHTSSKSSSRRDRSERDRSERSRDERDRRERSSRDHERYSRDEYERYERHSRDEKERRRERSRDSKDSRELRDREHKSRREHRESTRERSRERTRDKHRETSGDRRKSKSRERGSRRGRSRTPEDVVSSSKSRRTEREEGGSRNKISNETRSDEKTDSKGTVSFKETPETYIIPSEIPNDDNEGEAQVEIKIGLSEDTKTLLEAQEEKIRQRRERVEQWRRERESNAAKENPPSTEDANGSAKKWSLEDEEEEEEAPVNEEGNEVEKVDVKKQESADEDDPLDAFMMDIQAETDIINKRDQEIISVKNANDRRNFTQRTFEEEDEESAESEPEDILALAAKRLKKKDVPTINHKEVSYPPFRKDFYTEPTDMRNMDAKEVDALREELGGIKIRGENAPKPIKKWVQCGFTNNLLSAISKQNFETPTPIQAQAIPAVMSGRDVIGVAKTGSGKTLAFLLPMFRHILDQPPLQSSDGPITLIMTPTRELATQIHRDCKPFLKALGFRAICAYGGTGMQNQINDIKRGAEIIVCTPGRMIDLLCTNSGRLISLSRVTMLVLDEADRMFDMGFEPQVMKIVNNVRPDRQTVLFSATFPRQMEALARKILKKPLEITVGGRSVVCSDVHQIVEVREEKTKFIRLLEILGNFYQTDEDNDLRTLIFVDRQESADNLLRDLIAKCYPCLSLHGGKNQDDRDTTIADFKAGECSILIATSIAARGLDVKKLALVINYDCPNHMEDYVHRVGRTGRAGNKGTAYTFITPNQDKYANDIVKALKASDGDVSPELQVLVDEFQAKVQSGKAQVAGTGFGGKGLEILDKQRDLVKFVQRKTYGNDDDNSTDEDEEIKIKEFIADSNKKEANTSTQDSAAPSTSAGSASHVGGVPQAVDFDAAIRQAHINAARVNAAVSASHKPGDVIAKINAEFRGRGGDYLDHAIPPPPSYSEEVDINNYPQKARWKVTNKEQINLITDISGASITTRGEYIPSNETIPLGSGRRKLHLFVEADNEIAVATAVSEINRLLREATLLAMDSESRNPGGNPQARYNVL